MKQFVCLATFSPVGDSLSSASPKESDQRRGDPDDWPDPTMLRKEAERKKLASRRQFFVVIALVFPLLGANQRGPVKPIFDRFAMRTTRTRMRISGCIVNGRSKPRQRQKTLA